MIKPSIIVLFFTATMITAAYGEQHAKCLMDPFFLRAQIPYNGFIWMGNEGFRQDCEVSPKPKWERYSSPVFDLCASVEGPFGSGRYWTVKVGLAENQEMNPARGICLSTSTVGWRTLQRFHRLPLPWIADLNNDEKPELLIWDSFVLHKEASIAESGLMAWVYQFDANGNFIIDWSLSRQMAKEIVAAYRKPLDNNSPELQSLRFKIALALEAFALAQCETKSEPAR